MYDARACDVKHNICPIEREGDKEMTLWNHGNTGNRFSLRGGTWATGEEEEKEG